MREVAVDADEGIVRTIPSSRSSTASSIHKSEPKRFNEARDIADRFKDGIPVIMNLQSTDDTIARRLVDFASGLVYGLDGKIEMAHFEKMTQNKIKDKARFIAPACGLYLVNIEYERGLI